MPGLVEQFESEQDRGTGELTWETQLSQKTNKQKKKSKGYFFLLADEQNSKYKYFLSSHFH